MVGMEADEGIFLRVVQAGVLGYVLKDASAVEVSRTIRAVAAGDCGLSRRCFHPRYFTGWQGINRPIPSLHLRNSLGLSLREQELVG